MLTAAALAPLAAVFLLLVLARWPATRAMPAAYGVAVAAALWAWGMPPRAIAAASLRGAMIALSLLWIILPALALLYTLRETGGLATIRAGFHDISPDPRVQALLVAWLFGSFMEGAAGFGTPAAVAGPLLVALGFPAMAACALALIIQSTPVTFGAVGTPIIIGMGESLNVPRVTAVLATRGVEYEGFIRGIGASAATIHAIAGLLVPFLVLAVLGKVFGPDRSARRALEMWRFALFAGLAFVIPYVTLAWLLGPEFPSLLGSLVALAIVVPAARHGFLLDGIEPWSFPEPKQWDPRWRGSLNVGADTPATGGPAADTAAGSTATSPDRNSPDGATSSSEPSTEGRKEAHEAMASKMSLLRAWSPYVVAAVLLVMTRIPAFGIRPLLQSVQLSWNSILGTPLSQSIQPLYLPGTVLALAALLAPLLHRRPAARVARRAWGGAALTLARPTLALLFAVALVRIFIDSGLNGSGLESMPLYLAGQLASAVGGAGPFFAPWVGAMGAFVAGSNTVSDLMFAVFQFGIATAAGLPLTLVLGLQAVGGAAGNMITVHNVVAASATVGLVGEEGSLIRLTLIPMIVYLIIAGSLGLLLARGLTPWLL
ncbi:MAG: L-lactate permease [Acidobacteriota bacterium]